MLAKWFFKVLDTGDLRYILLYDKLPELPEYEIDIIIPAWDIIIDEYEKLTNDSSFSYRNKEVNYEAADHNRLMAIKAAFYLMEYEPEAAVEWLKYWKIKVPDTSVKSMMFIKNRILSIQSDLHIKSIMKGKEDGKKGTYMDSIIFIENTLGRTIDQETLSVTKWVALINSSKEKIKILQKHGRHT